MPPVLGEFGSMLEFSNHLAGRQVAIYAAMQKQLHEIGRVMSNKMQTHLGTYHPAIGPFPRWQPLAFSTLHGFGPWPGKIALGQAPPDNPLIAKGDLHNSFSYDVRGIEMEVGSTDPVMKFHEWGTSRMPPRPVVGPVAFRSIDRIKQLAAAAVVAGLISPAQAAGLFSFAPTAAMDRLSR